MSDLNFVLVPGTICEGMAEMRSDISHLQRNVGDLIWSDTNSSREISKMVKDQMSITQQMKELSVVIEEFKVTMERLRVTMEELTDNLVNQRTVEFSHGHINSIDTPTSPKQVINSMRLAHMAESHERTKLALLKMQEHDIRMAMLQATKNVAVVEAVKVSSQHEEVWQATDTKMSP